MFTAGAVYCQPDDEPLGQLAGAKDAARLAAGPSTPAARRTPSQTSRPVSWCTPAPGSPASADSTLSPVRAHASQRSGGPQRTGPQIAPAAADVVAAGGAAVITRVASPASASEIGGRQPDHPGPDHYGIYGSHRHDATTPSGASAVRRSAA